MLLASALVIQHAAGLHTLKQLAFKLLLRHTPARGMHATSATITDGTDTTDDRPGHACRGHASETASSSSSLHCQQLDRWRYAAAAAQSRLHVCVKCVRGEGGVTLMCKACSLIRTPAASSDQCVTGQFKCVHLQLQGRNQHHS